MSRILASLAAAALLIPAATAQTERLRAGFDLTAVAPPGGVPFGTALAADPASADGLYASVGFFGSQRVVHLNVSDPSAPVSKLLADGAADLVGADNVLDSRFGNVGGLALLPNGDLIIVDNASPFSGGPGETIFRARDLNSDGDFRDVVASTPEVAPLVGSVPGVGFSFSGAEAEVAADGTLYVVTSDGSNAGDIIRVTNPTTSPSATLYFTGLDYGAGLAIRANGIWAGDVDDTFGFARIWHFEDLNADGDAMDAGESNPITSALPNIFDLTFANDGRLHVSAAINFFSASEIITADPGASILRSDFQPSDGVVMGDVVAQITAAPFGPHAGTGQRLFAVGDNFASVNRLYILEPAPSERLDLSEPLFTATSISPPSLAAGEFGGPLSVDPNSPELASAALGSFGDQQIWQFDLTDPAYPIYHLTANGASDTNADNQLDSNFGNVSGLAPLPTGQMVIVENFAPFSTGQGDTVFLATDLNSDGDFLDIVAAQPEVKKLVASLPGTVNFSGVQAEIGPDGAVYVVTSDGGNLGEVLRIANPLTTPSTTIYYNNGANGIDFGSGLAWFTDGASPELFVGDVDDAFFPARIRRLVDLNSDGDAQDAGESSVLPNVLPGVYDITAGPGGTLWASQFTEIDEISRTDGSLIRLFATPTPTMSFNAFADLVFAGPGDFEPGAVQRSSLLVASNDFAGISFLHVITPAESNTTAVSDYQLYR